MSEQAPRRAFGEGEPFTLWMIWMTYGSFYFCRVNLSAAIPGMEKELDLSKSQIATILGSLKIAYGLGQFINGQLAERFRPRVLLALGMVTSAALNVVFGLGTGFYFLLFVWAMNGYSQALGWTPCMRVAARWFPTERRGRAIGIIGTGYQVTAAATFVISGWAVIQFGWRGALYVSSALLLASAVNMLLFLRESPEAGGAGAASGDDSEGRGGGAALAGDPGTSVAPEDTSTHAGQARWKVNLHATVSNPALWFLALSLGLLNACRYGFQDWGIVHLNEVLGDRVDKAAVKYALLPIGGIGGAVAAGWATDRWFGGRRAPVIVVLLVVLGLLSLAYDRVIHFGLVPTCLILICIGFCIYGPQVLLVGTAPLDLAKRGTTAAAVGFVNFVGYIGAATGDQVTGSLVDRHGWSAAVSVWSAFAFCSAVAVCFLWGARAAAPASRPRSENP